MATRCGFNLQTQASYKRQVVRLVGVMALCSLAVALTARAAWAEPSGAAAASQGPNDWELRFILPLWLPFSTATSKTDIGMPSSAPSTLETKTSIQWVVLAVLEGGYEHLSARVDAFGGGFHDRLVHDGTTTNAAYDSSGILVRGLLGYELGPYRRGPRRRYSITPLVGVRYTQLNFSVPERPSLAGDYRWVDPLLGARADFTLDRFRVMTELDFGGFGVGSDFALWAQVSGEYMLVRWCGLWGGWQHFEVLLDQPVKYPDRRMLLYLTGPAVGFAFHVF